MRTLCFIILAVILISLSHTGCANKPYKEKYIFREPFPEPQESSSRTIKKQTQSKDQSIPKLKAKTLKKIQREGRQKGKPIVETWLHQPPSLWGRSLTNFKTDVSIPLPTQDLSSENIGTKKRTADLFDTWIFKEGVLDGYYSSYAEVTKECKGRIEINFAPTSQEWISPIKRMIYFKRVNLLIDMIGKKLLKDFGNTLVGKERKFFIRALKTLAWQESAWQHYFRYKDWFFVSLSNPFNNFGDWGITQIARSSHDSRRLLNQPFFKYKGHCSISSTLYYGFLFYYFCYLDARKRECNGGSLINELLGAYNRYFSGFSTCFNHLSKTDKDYRDFQIRTLDSFRYNFMTKPWEKRIDGDY